MADIGDKLRSAREAKGLSIADVEKATKIQSRYLTAIEKNDFDKLPGDFYVRAFIRQYAQVVGLDGKKLLSEYHKEIPKAEPDDYVEDSVDNKSEKVRKTTNNKKNLWKNYLPRIAIGLGVIIVILIVYALYAHLSSNHQNDNANSSVSVSSQMSSSSSKKPAKSLVKIVPLGNNQYRVTGLKNNRRLVVRAGNQNVTSTVSVNGKVQWSQNLLANQKHTMNIPKNAQSVAITFGNDTGTSVSVAGKKVPYKVRNGRQTLTLLIGKHKNKGKIKSQTTNQTNTNNSNTTTNNNNRTTMNNNQGRQTGTNKQPQSKARPQQSTQSTQQQSSQSKTQTQPSTSSTNNNNANSNGK
ncbi:helix-turn-helix domain-containing protein [Lactobacillus acetotolerans]|uniref:helix-turn-helix domain-containing protein n=1 Tax=Lactobacillus acetotolerans TaxID=1600 RepID=UPI0007BA26A3|nr:RodZ family helix-turn-helix domain-containing protein [Lactobacillus acetotolerans]